MARVLRLKLKFLKSGEDVVCTCRNEQNDVLYPFHTVSCLVTDCNMREDLFVALPTEECEGVLNGDEPLLKPGDVYIVVDQVAVNIEGTFNTGVKSRDENNQPIQWPIDFGDLQDYTIVEMIWDRQSWFNVFTYYSSFLTNLLI